jgi:hypothetical protein
VKCVITFSDKRGGRVNVSAVFTPAIQPNSKKKPSPAQAAAVDLLSKLAEQTGSTVKAFK